MGKWCCRSTFRVYTVHPAGSENPNVNRAPGCSWLAGRGRVRAERWQQVPTSAPVVGAPNTVVLQRRKKQPSALLVGPTCAPRLLGLRIGLQLLEVRDMAIP